MTARWKALNNMEFLTLSSINLA